jgi:Rieske Fe-S protein
MSGEDQERFEDYLELEHYIEELQAGHVAHPPAELTPSQASIYRMAALFRASLPEANEPSPEFAAELQARLEQELQQPQQPEQSAPRPQTKRRFGLSRRAMLSGGAAIAASLVVGIGGGAMIEHAVAPGNANPQGPAANGTQTNTWQPPLVPPSIPTVWHQVTSLAALGNNAVSFAAGGVIGYVIRDKAGNSDPANGDIIAMSAACTHMGCIVQWQSSDRKFHCPCHGGLFTENGKVDTGRGPVRYLTALPRLQTKIENGSVYVQVPALPNPR